MACSDHSTMIDFWTNWQFFDGVYCFYSDQLGAGVIAFLFFFVTASTMYNATDSAVTPLVVGLLGGGVIFALLPAAGIEVALLLMIMAVAAAMYLLARRSALA